MRTLAAYVGLLVIASRLAVAQPAALTLQDCVRLALGAPSAVTLARQDAAIASYGITAARAGFLPQVSIGNAFTYNSPAVNSFNNVGSFVALNGVREYQSVAATALDIDTSGRLRAAFARARADQQIAGVNIALTERDLRRAIVGAYYRLLLTRHLASANRELLDEALTFARRTEAAYKAGEVARADFVKAESQLAFLEQTLRASELDSRIANAELAAFWTHDVQTELVLNDTLMRPLPPPSDVDTRAPDSFLRRPEFRRLDAEKLGFEADYRRERAALLPQLTLNYQYGLDANQIAWNDRGQAAFFTFNIPVFDWFHARSLAQQFKERAAQVDTQRTVAVRQFSRDHENALNRVKLIFEQIGLTERQVSASVENLKLARIRYEGGEGPALEVVVAQSQLSQARTNYFTALASYAVARSELEVTSGR